MRKNWIAAEELDTTAADVELLEVPAESLESDLVEVTGLDKDVESLVADGEELEHDTDTVEALADNAEASLEEEGMDETAARATEIAAEAFCAKWGVRRAKVGAEAFGSADTRRRATTIAVESLKDSVVSMWETFVKWIKEIIAKGKDLLLKLVNAGKSMKKRAEKLETRLDAGLGVLDKQKISGSFIKQVMIDEKVNFAGVLEYANKAPNDIVHTAAKVKTALTEAGKIVRLETKPSTAKNTPINIEFGKKVSKVLNAPQGATEIEVHALPGNGYVTAYLSSDGDVYSVKFAAAPDKGDVKEVDTLTADECAKGVKALFAIGETLETKLKGFRTANESLEGLVKDVTTAAKKLKDAKAEERDEARKALAIARSVVTAFKATERAVTYSLTSAGQGIAGYVAASIGAYKKD